MLRPAQEAHFSTPTATKAARRCALSRTAAYARENALPDL